MPEFPLVPASKGFCLSLDTSLENFKAACKAANLLWLFNEKTFLVSECNNITKYVKLIYAPLQRITLLRLRL